MTSYASNFTPRYKARYLAGGIEHTIQVRAARGASFSVTEALRGPVRDAYMAVVAIVYDDFAWISAEVALTDSDVFGPATVPDPLVGNIIDPALNSAMLRISPLTFTGRSAGSKGRFSMFGVSFGTDAAAALGGDGKLTSAEVAGISTIAGVASANFRAGSGEPAIYPLLATVKPNDHLLRLVRRGTIT